MSRAVVTGAASGIGRATALLLLERGAQVVAADRDEAGLAAPADAGAETVVCDVADRADRARLLDAAGAACDHLVNSAGIIRLAAVPLARLGDAREVAEVIAFLLSDASSYMTGQSVNVTGGMITY